MENINNISSHDELLNSIQKWVSIDQQLQLVNDKTKKMRETRSILTSNICGYMKNNNIKGNIGITDGELRLYEKKEYKSLSFTYITNCLENIIKDKSQVEQIVKYLKDNREITTSSEIKRFSAK